MSFTSVAESDIGFYGLSISSKDKEYKLNIPDDRTLNITSVSLAVQSLNDKSNTSLVAVCQSNNKPVEYVICTLNALHVPSRQLELLFIAEQDIKLKVVGAGTLHLTGYTTIVNNEQYDTDNEQLDQFIDADGNPIALNSHMNGNGQYFDDSDDSDELDDGAEFDDEDDSDIDSHDIDTSNGKIQVIQSDEEAEDDEDMDDSENESEQGDVPPVVAPKQQLKATPAKSSPALQAQKRKADTVPTTNDKKAKIDTKTPATPVVTKTTVTKTTAVVTPAPAKTSGGNTATPNTNTNTKSDNKQSVKCTQCDKVANSEQALKQHIAAKHGAATPIASKPAVAAKAK